MADVTDATHPRSQRHRKVKDHLAATPHPPWVTELLAAQKPAWEAVAGATAFRATAEGAFPEQTWRRIIKEFWCVVEAFPKYMGLTLAKTTYGKSPRDHLARDWLIGNIRIEALHAAWYIDWAKAHDIGEAELFAHRPSPEVAALHEWLFSVAHRGSLAQAAGAINFAIEGTTGEWSRYVYPAFERRYGGGPAAERSLAWLTAHAKYDDLHPIEALEIVKLAARPDEQGEVASSILRSLELFARGFEACCDDDVRRR